MSLPVFSTQAELFSTAGLSAGLFAPTDRYRLFAKLVYPPLAAKRAALAKCYCADNGRVALEPVLMMGVSLLQELEGLPDRQAVEMLRYHAGWNFAQGGIFGVSVSGTGATGILQSTLTGPVWLSGGEFGAEASVVAIAICGTLGIALFFRVRSMNGLIAPYWRRAPAATLP